MAKLKVKFTYSKPGDQHPLFGSVAAEVDKVYTVVLANDTEDLKTRAENELTKLFNDTFYGEIKNKLDELRDEVWRQCRSSEGVNKLEKLINEIWDLTNFEKS